MGNHDADALRAELRGRILDTYGDFTAAASEMNIPYKTLYRAFTLSGKDRTDRVSLDVVMDVVAHLQSRNPAVTFAEIYADALRRNR